MTEQSHLDAMRAAIRGDLERARARRPSIFERPAAAPPEVEEPELLPVPVNEPEPEVLDNIIPIGQRRTLLELNEATCRWPIGDPGSADFFFCGGQTVTSLPYCAYHSRVAYQPPNQRRDRRPPR